MTITKSGSVFILLFLSFVLPTLQFAEAEYFNPTKVNKTVSLPVPLIKQAYPLSCEAASLQMALAYRGVNVGQDQLLGNIGRAEPFKQINRGGLIEWGDPDIGFVGNVKGYMVHTNGSFVGVTGWGVNNGPVARVAIIYRPGSFEKDNAGLLDIKNAIDDGNPVIFWHVRGGGTGRFLSYTTPAGRWIKMRPNHVAVIVGYEETNVGTFYSINDPLFGRLRLAEATLLSWWGAYNNEMAVVL